MNGLQSLSGFRLSFHILNVHIYETRIFASELVCVCVYLTVCRVVLNVVCQWQRVKILVQMLKA